MAEPVKLRHLDEAVEDKNGHGDNEVQEGANLQESWN